MDSILSILKSFQTISLADMEEVKLLNRVDTKFLFKSEKFADLLHSLKNEYDVVEINNELAIPYHSTYFDTEDFLAFREHHRGKNSRFKVRIRNYVNSKLSFLEIKKKHKGRTIKERIEVDVDAKGLNTYQNDFIKRTLGEDLELIPTLGIAYHRVTIVHKNKEERITFDINLSYEGRGGDKTLHHIIIGELKQAKLNRSSTFYQEAKKHQLRNIRISKYCTGMVLMYPKLKYNRFKHKLLFINKLSNGYIFRNIAA